MHGLRGSKSEILEGIALEDVEDLANDRASRARRRRRDNVIAAIIALDGRKLANLVLLQIRLGDDALAGRARGGNRIGDRPLVERVRASLRDQDQGLRQILLHQAIAGLERLTAVEKDGRRCFIVLEISVGGGEERNVALIEHKPTFGEADRRRDQCTA